MIALAAIPTITIFASEPMGCKGDCAATCQGLCAVERTAMCAKGSCLHVVECVIVLVRVLVKCLENVTIVQIFAREVALVVAMALVRTWLQEKIQ